MILPASTDLYVEGFAHTGHAPAPNKCTLGHSHFTTRVVHRVDQVRSCLMATLCHHTALVFSYMYGSGIFCQLCCKLLLKLVILRAFAHLRMLYACARIEHHDACIQRG
jgi:hypothetical protein